GDHIKDMVVSSVHIRKWPARGYAPLVYCSRIGGSPIHAEGQLGCIAAGQCTGKCQECTYWGRIFNDHFVGDGGTSGIILYIDGIGPGLEVSKDGRGLGGGGGDNGPVIDPVQAVKNGAQPPGSQGRTDGAVGIPDTFQGLVGRG